MLYKTHGGSGMIVGCVVTGLVGIVMLVLIGDPVTALAIRCSHMGGK